MYAMASKHTHSFHKIKASHTLEQPEGDNSPLFRLEQGSRVKLVGFGIFKTFVYGQTCPGIPLDSRERGNDVEEHGNDEVETVNNEIESGIT